MTVPYRYFEIGLGHSTWDARWLAVRVKLLRDLVEEMTVHADEVSRRGHPEPEIEVDTVAMRVWLSSGQFSNSNPHCVPYRTRNDHYRYNIFVREISCEKFLTGRLMSTRGVK